MMYYIWSIYHFKGTDLKGEFILFFVMESKHITTYIV
jgi:hypothetical protein